ncbi:MAG TPA: hypothetical protein VH165_12725 [Kofleriaceae bacterium]|jgi:hypothetical protein|nr:hypothetical protein [Kofleriaceae bacterium]
MVKTCLLVFGAAGALAACSQDNSTALKDLSTTYGDTTIEIVARSQVNVLLHVNGDSCPTLSDDAVAMFDGQQMEVSRGGYAQDATGCYPIAFWFNKFPADVVSQRERTSNGAEMIIKDASQTWHIAPTQMFGNELTNDTVASRLVWPNVDNIATAVVYPTVDLRIAGDNVYYPAGTNVTFAQVRAFPAVTLCDGPGTCSVDLQRDVTFGTSLPL